MIPNRPPGPVAKPPITFADGMSKRLAEFERVATTLQSRYSLDKPQMDVARHVVSGGNTLLLAPPGCGKTHVTRFIMEAMRALYGPILGVIALPYMAKNIEGLTVPGTSAMTMSRFLCQQRDGTSGEESFKRKIAARDCTEWRGGAANVWPAESRVFFVIDEFPIMPKALVEEFVRATQTLKSVRNVITTGILFVGDAYQGGPVSGDSPLSMVLARGPLSAKLRVLNNQHRYAHCRELGDVMNYLRYMEKPRSQRQWDDYNARAQTAVSIMRDAFTYKPGKAEFTLTVSNRQKARKINKLFSFERGPKLSITPSKVSRKVRRTGVDGSLEQTWIKPGGLVRAVENHMVKREDGEGLVHVFNGETYTVVDYPGSSTFADTVADIEERVTKRARVETSKSMRIEAKTLMGLDHDASGPVPHVRIRAADGSVLLATAIESRGYLYFPFDDARVMTIKKSQGMTVNADTTMLIDMTDCPDERYPDMLGLALSRAQSISNVLIPNCDVDLCAQMHRKNLIDRRVVTDVHQKVLLRQLQEEGLTAEPAHRSTVLPPPAPPLPMPSSLH